MSELAALILVAVLLAAVAVADIIRALRNTNDDDWQDWV